MVTIKQSEDDYYFLHALSEQSKCPRMLLRGNSPGITIPLYLLGSHSALENGASGWLFSTPEEEQSLLDSLLLAQWEDHAWKGHLRYDVTTCEMKVIDGKSKFVAQLNEIEDNKVLQKQDPLTFKCLKTHGEPLLFCVSSGEKTNPEFIHSATVPDDATLIIVNANPVEYGHVFLVPHGLNSRLQFMDARSLEMVTRVAVEINNCSFRVFYDYLTSSADHPSFQACYFANCLPVELMPAVTIYGDHCGRGIQICDIKDYPMKAFLFKGNGNLKALVEVVAEICSCLQDQTIPYSLLISDCGTKMFLFPQVRTLAMACGLSAWECGGYFVFKERCEFDQATEEDVLKRLSTFSLEDEHFSVVKQLCCSVASKLAT